MARDRHVSFCKQAAAGQPPAYAAPRFFFACPTDLASASSSAVMPSGPDDSNAFSSLGGPHDEYPKLPRETNQDESVGIILRREPLRRRRSSCLGEAFAG